MSNPHLSLLKTCSSCGQQKPLSAFRQFAGAHGSMYGNICASCRKAHSEKSAPKETEEGTTRKSDHRIGIEEKVHADLTKKFEYKRIKEELHRSREKNEKNQMMKIEKTEMETDKTRKAYTEGLWKKTSTENKPAVNPSSQPILGSPEQARKAGEINLQNPLVGQNLTFARRVASLLGNTPLAMATKNAADQAMKQTTPTSDQKEKKKMTEKTDADPLMQAIEKHLPPRPKR